MDYFIAFPAHTADRGLTDLFVRASVNVSESVSGNVWIHHFGYEKEFRINLLDEGRKNLGQEVDCVVQYRYNSAVGFDLGLSAFLPDETMRQKFGGAGTGFWGFFVTSVSF